MKASDVINQLKAVLPEITDLFSDVYTISSLTYDSNTGLVTAVTSVAHNHTTDDVVNITGSNNPIDILSIVRNGTEALVTTVSDHDLTLSVNDIGRDNKTVLLSGSIEAEFNGTFKLKEVLNSREFKITIADVGATESTGTPLLEDGSRTPGFNGRHFITVIDPTTFTYISSVTLAATATGTPLAKFDVRVSGAANLEEALNAYTEHATGLLWAFVILGDVVASKNRNIQSDLIDVLTKSDSINQRLSQTFNILVITPSSDDIGGLDSRDLMEDVFVYLNKSLVGVKFPTGFYSSENYITTFLEHGFNGFNGAYYTHLFSYEMAADLTFNDTVGYDHDVAFREFDLSVTSDVGTKEDSITSLNTRLEVSEYIAPPSGPQNSYAVLLGGDNNAFTAPSFPAHDLLGDFEIIAKISLTDWYKVTGAGQSIISKYQSGQRSFRTEIHASGGINFGKSSDGTLTDPLSLSSLVTLTDNQIMWLRASFEKDTGDVAFYISTESEINDPSLVTWVSHGPSGNSGVTSPFNSTAPIEVGTINGGTALEATGNFYRCVVIDGKINEGGNIVIDFNPNEYVGGGSWLSSSGHTWTLEGSASIVLVD